MGGKRTGRAGSRTPCRRGALWPVEHCWCRYCSLITFTADLAQRPLPSETQGTSAISHWYSFALDELGLSYRTFETAPTFPPMSVLFRGCACVWLETPLGFEFGRSKCAWICLHLWGGADLKGQFRITSHERLRVVSCTSEPQQSVDFQWN